MYSLTHREKDAHDKSIWCCDWKTLLYGGDDCVKHECIVSGSVDGSIGIWRFKNNVLELNHKIKQTFAIISLAIDAKSKIAATSSFDLTLRTIDLKSGEIINKLERTPLQLWTLTFTSDGKYILSGSNAGKVHEYKAASLELNKCYDCGVSSFILCVACDNSDRYVACSSKTGGVFIFNRSTEKLMHGMEVHSSAVRSVSFSPNSNLLATASDDNNIKLIDVQHGNVMCTLTGHTSWVTSVNYSPDGQYIVSTSRDKTVKVWEVSSQQCISTLKDHSGEVWSAKFSPDGNMIISVSEDKTINIFKCPNL